MVFTSPPPSRALESNFLRISAGIGEEKIAGRRRGIRKKILGSKASVLPQASRIQAFITVEIERVYNIFYLVGLALFGFFMNIIVMSS